MEKTSPRQSVSNNVFSPTPRTNKAIIIIIRRRRHARDDVDDDDDDQKECVFVEKKKKECTQKVFSHQNDKKKMNPFPTTNTTTKKNASFCNPKHIFSTKKRKKKSPQKGARKRGKRGKKKEKEGKDLLKRDTLCGRHLPLSLSLSLFFSLRVRYINPEFSAKDRHANTREEGKGKKRALSRFIRAFARKGDALFVSSRGRKERERERIQFSL